MKDWENVNIFVRVELRFKEHILNGGAGCFFQTDQLLMMGYRIASGLLEDLELFEF